MKKTIVIGHNKATRESLLIIAKKDPSIIVVHPDQLKENQNEESNK